MEIISAPINELAIKNRPILGRIFVCLLWCSNRRIASYVTVATLMKTDKKQAILDDYLFPAP
jgi:hypothetical protein